MKRKPQPRCKCGHALTKHHFYPHYNMNDRICGYCWDRCLNFRQDNLATLEKLSEFAEQKSN